MIDHLSVQGPSLAAWLQSAAFGGRYCDGLLFGSLVTDVSTQAHDHDESVTTISTSCTISAALACTSTHLFYDAAGAINTTRLAHLLQQAQQQQQQLVGWWVYRPGALQLHPSLREAAITRALSQWCSQQQQQRAPKGSSAADRPLLFAVLSSEEGHNGATHALQQRVYQYAPSSSNQTLQLVRLHIDNLGQDRPSTSGSSGHQHSHNSSSQQQAGQQQQARGSGTTGSATPAPGSLLSQALQATGMDATVLQQLQGAVAAAQQQAGVLGGVHATLLQQLEGLAEQVVAEDNQLVALRQQSQGLLEQVQQQQQQQQAAL